MFKGTAIVVSIFIAAALGGTPRGHAAVDEREMRAREAFAVGHYQEALDLFAKLYAEKLHPNYLRNIGRCYQNLGDPDKAITSFKDYLRKAKTVAPDERQEVEGYIKEMQDLKAQRDAATKTPDTGHGADDPTRAPGPPNGAGSTAITPPAGGAARVPHAADVTPPPPGPAGAQLTNGAEAADAPDQASPIYQRWWFWLIVGGVAAAGLGTAAALGAFTKTEDAQCPGGGTRC